jgi:hypothetical protein
LRVSSTEQAYGRNREKREISDMAEHSQILPLCFLCAG